MRPLVIVLGITLALGGCGTKEEAVPKAARGATAMPTAATKEAGLLSCSATESGYRTGGGEVAVVAPPGLECQAQVERGRYTLIVAPDVDAWLADISAGGASVTAKIASHPPASAESHGEVDQQAGNNELALSTQPGYAKTKDADSPTAYSITQTGQIQDPSGKLLPAYSRDAALLDTTGDPLIVSWLSIGGTLTADGTAIDLEP